MLQTILLKEAGDGVMAYHIFGNATLELISKRIPTTKEELLEVNGPGNVKVSKYGDRILDTIASTIKEFCLSGRNQQRRGSANDDNLLTLIFPPALGCTKEIATTCMQILLPQKM